MASPVELSDLEVSVLSNGLNEWLGPGRCTDELAVAIGFDGVEDFHSAIPRLRTAIDDREMLTSTDWRRVLLATEIVFMSDVVGSGHDWMFTTGLPDTETVAIIRGLQRKLPIAR
jgi:hypothetical protein